MFVNCTLGKFFELAAEQYGKDWQERKLFLVGLVMAPPSSQEGTEIARRLGELHAISGTDLHLFAPGHKYSGKIEEFFRVDDKNYGFNHLDYQKTRRELNLIFPEFSQFPATSKPHMVLAFFDAEHRQLAPGLGCIIVSIGERGISSVSISDFIESLVGQMQKQQDYLHLHLASIEKARSFLARCVDGVLTSLPRLSPFIHLFRAFQ